MGISTLRVSAAIPPSKGLDGIGRQLFDVNAFHGITGGLRGFLVTKAAIGFALPILLIGIEFQLQDEIANHDVFVGDDELASRALQQAFGAFPIAWYRWVWEG